MSNEEQPVALVTECDGEHAKFYPQPAPAPQAAEALRSLVEIIDAAGLLNLSNGVQLGQVSWYVKALGCMDAARAALAAPQAERKPLTDEQMSEALEALPKVGEKESCWVAVRGSTLRALLNAHGIGAQQEPKA